MTAKAPCKCRYDAAGHKILSRADMQLYYKGDKNSVDIVTRNMPHRYVCIPDVEIRLDLQDCRSALVYLIYPGETIEKVTLLSDRNLDVLRHYWRWGRKNWKMEKRTGYIVFHRKGSVKLDPMKRYGIWA